MHLVPRLARPVHAVAAALSVLALLVAGCGSNALAKQPPFPRSTIQANAADPSEKPVTGSTSTGEPADPAFAADKLRLLDPCKLLDADTLPALFGEQAGTLTPWDCAHVTLYRDTSAARLDDFPSRRLA